MQAIHTWTRQNNPERAGVSTLLAAGVARIFGCWHREMSRPFTCGGETYRVCLGCGARRQFNLESWQTLGAYRYHSPSSPRAPRRARRAGRRPLFARIAA